MRHSLHNVTFMSTCGIFINNNDITVTDNAIKAPSGSLLLFAFPVKHYWWLKRLPNLAGQIYIAPDNSSEGIISHAMAK